MGDDKVELIRQADIRRVIELSRVRVAQQIIEPIEVGLNRLKQEAVTRILVPDLPHIVMSESTVRKLFDGFRGRLDEDKYRQIILDVGEEVGEAFGTLFLRFLKDNALLPQGREVLFNIWAEYDSGANWGTFKAHLSEDKITISVSDSFLTRGRERNRHANCNFMAGYLLGLSWRVLLEYDRWFNRVIARVREKHTQVVSVREHAEQDCQYVINLREEELTDSFDLLFAAKEAQAEGNHADAAMRARTALETVYFEKLGLTDVHSALPRVLRAYAQFDNSPEAARMNRRAQELWNRISQDVAHAKDVRLDATTASEVLDECEDILIFQERRAIGKPRRQSIIDTLRAEERRP